MHFLLYSIYGYLSSPFWAIIFLFFLKSRVYSPYSTMKKFKTKKYLLSGRQIPSDFYYYINEVSDTSAVKYRFELKNEEKCYLIEYEIELQKNGKKSFCISKEKFIQREMSEGKRITPVFDYQKGRKELFRPLKLYERFSKDIQNVIALGVAELATQNYNEEKGVPEVSSFLFSRKAQEVFEKAEGEAELLSLLS